VFADYFLSGTDQIESWQCTSRLQLVEVLIRVKEVQVSHLSRPLGVAKESWQLLNVEFTKKKQQHEKMSWMLNYGNLCKSMNRKQVVELFDVFIRV